jgi:hypothetical protein
MIFCKAERRRGRGAGRPKAKSGERSAWRGELKNVSEFHVSEFQSFMLSEAKRAEGQKWRAECVER